MGYYEDNINPHGPMGGGPSKRGPFQNPDGSFIQYGPGSLGSGQEGSINEVRGASIVQLRGLLMKLGQSDSWRASNPQAYQRMLSTADTLLRALNPSGRHEPLTNPDGSFNKALPWYNEMRKSQLQAEWMADPKNPDSWNRQGGKNPPQSGQIGPYHRTVTQPPADYTGLKGYPGHDDSFTWPGGQGGGGGGGIGGDGKGPPHGGPQAGAGGQQIGAGQGGGYGAGPSMGPPPNGGPPPPGNGGSPSWWTGEAGGAGTAASPWKGPALPAASQGQQPGTAFGPGGNLNTPEDQRPENIAAANMQSLRNFLRQGGQGQWNPITGSIVGDQGMQGQGGPLSLGQLNADTIGKYIPSGGAFKQNYADLMTQLQGLQAQQPQGGGGGFPPSMSPPPNGGPPQDGFQPDAGQMAALQQLLGSIQGGPQQGYGGPDWSSMFGNNVPQYYSGTNQPSFQDGFGGGGGYGGGLDYGAGMDALFGPSRGTDGAYNTFAPPRHPRSGGLNTLYGRNQPTNLIPNPNQGGTRESVWNPYTGKSDNMFSPGAGQPPPGWTPQYANQGGDQVIPHGNMWPGSQPEPSPALAPGPLAGMRSQMSPDQWQAFKGTMGGTEGLRGLRQGMRAGGFNTGPSPIGQSRPGADQNWGGPTQTPNPDYWNPQRLQSAAFNGSSLVGERWRNSPGVQAQTAMPDYWNPQRMQSASPMPTGRRQWDLGPPTSALQMGEEGQFGQNWGGGMPRGLMRGNQPFGGGTGGGWY